jgi:hypothetical protein
VPSGAIDFTLYYTADPTVITDASYVPLASFRDAAGLAANRFAAYNASVPAPPEPVFGSFWLVAYFTYASPGYTEDLSARLVVLGRVTFPAPDGFVCAGARSLTGTSGSTSGTTAGSGPRARVLPVTCAAGAGRTATARTDAGQAWLALDLGLTPATTGGSLTLSTCAAGTRFNTVLWAGYSTAFGRACPTLPTQFQCRAYDADSSSCAAPGTTGASTLTMAVPGTQLVYVLVSGAAADEPGASEGAFTLTWRYTPPSPSRRPSRSRSRSRSRKPKRA